MSDTNLSWYEIGAGISMFVIFFYYILSILGFIIYCTKVKNPLVEEYRPLGNFPVLLVGGLEWIPTIIFNIFFAVISIPVVFFMWIPILIIGPISIIIYLIRKSKFGTA